MENTEEVIHAYCKAMGEDPDSDICEMCRELVDLFDESIAMVHRGEPGRIHFITKLQGAASYAGWQPIETKAVCP